MTHSLWSHVSWRLPACLLGLAWCNRAAESHTRVTVCYWYTRPGGKLADYKHWESFCQKALNTSQRTSKYSKAIRINFGSGVIRLISINFDLYKQGCQVHILVFAWWFSRKILQKCHKRWMISVVDGTAVGLGEWHEAVIRSILKVKMWPYQNKHNSLSCCHTVCRVWITAPVSANTDKDGSKDQLPDHLPK